MKLGRPAGVAPQIDPAGIAAAESPPGAQSNRFGSANLIVAAGIDESIFDQLFAALLVDVRISVGFGALAAGRFPACPAAAPPARSRDADREFAAGQIRLDKHRLLISRQ